MHIPYPNPSTLSDPYMDWQGSEAELEKVIASAPEDLGRDAYWMIFYQNLFDFFHRLQRFSAHQDKILRESDINQGYFQYNKRLLPN